jgi:hypothetical protein
LSDDGKDSGEVVTVQLPEEMIFKRPSGETLPGCILMDKKVHILGDFGEDETIFMASRIYGSGRQHDPTGVRSRLGKGCRMHGRYHKSGE